MKQISTLRDILKLEILIVYSYMYSWICRMKRERRTVLSINSLCGFWKQYKEARHYIGSHYQDLIYMKHIVLDARPLKTLSNIFCALIAVMWLCEKMKVNLKIEGLSYMFENDTVINNPSAYQDRCFEVEKKFLAGVANITWIGDIYMRSEYGYKILSQLLISRELVKCANKWFDSRIKGDWIAIHYRGTDLKEKLEDRYRYIEIDNYIIYLKRVLGNEDSIFVCSDQAQFIDKMHAAFPGKIYTRDIARSYDSRTLHRDSEYVGMQQKKDALVDVLILAKAKLLYTTGSGFPDTVRFLNPSIKIISLDGRWLFKGFAMGRGSPHGVPIPHKDFLKSLIKHHKNYEAS